MKKMLIALCVVVFATFSCAGMYQSHAVGRAMEDHNCQSVTVSATTSGGGDNGLDSYEMDVCGRTRRYAWISDPSSGSSTIRDITDGRPDVCEMMISTRTQNMVRMFYLRSNSDQGALCIDRLLSGGWRITNQRVAHNGNTSTGWGEEVTLTR